jgi:hypothetical protein
LRAGLRTRKKRASLFHRSTCWTVGSGVITIMLVNLTFQTSSFLPIMSGGEVHGS